METGELLDDARLAALRKDMLRFAELQLRDKAAAEDAVQEALIAATTNPQHFAGRSALKTWVFAILRNKIIDQMRQNRRTINESSLLDEYGEGDLETLFAANGHWSAEDRPLAWADPEESFSQRRFWVVFEICLTNLPENTARVFMMREFLGFETPEICAELGLSPSNCHVILHRARAGLRLCLERRWLVGETR